MTLNIVFAIILIIFTVKIDWSKSKNGRWFPFLFIILLVMYLLHNMLRIYTGLDLIAEIKIALARTELFSFIRKMFNS